MNIIVISERWGDEAGIGSLRPMKITKYLLKQGHKVTVVCGSRVKGFSNIGQDVLEFRKQGNYDELPIFDYSGIFKWENEIWEKWAAKRKKKKSNENERGEYKNSSVWSKGIKNKLIHWYNNYYKPFKQRNSVKVAYRYIKSKELNPDFIFSSYEPLEVHLLAKKIKKRYPSAVWNADFRDPLPWAWDPVFVYKYKQQLQKKICADADTVTIVSSSWCKEMKRQGIRNAHVLYSGYDLEDRVPDRSPVHSDEKLVFTYTGSLYPDKYNIYPFSRVIHALIEEKRINEEKIKLVYAGPDSAEFKNQTGALAGKCELVDYGLIPRASALALQNQSDILLLAAVNKKGGLGHITGKITEYWLVKKPVIAVISGDIPNAELAGLIKKANCGVAFEEANSEHDFEKLKEYILKQYILKMKTGNVYMDCDESFLNHFNYEEIVNKLLKITGLKKDGEKEKN